MERGRRFWEKELLGILGWPRVPSLASFRGFFSVILFIGARQELEKKRAHCRLRI
jgi:hypothetical protein